MFSDIKSALSNTLYKKAQQTLSTSFSSRCFVCQMPLDEWSHVKGLCQCCYKDLPSYHERTGCLLNYYDIRAGLNRPNWQHQLALAEYKWPFNQLISQFKYQNHYASGTLLTTLLKEKIQLELQQQPHLKPDVLIPVPLHPIKYLWRGFNQAQLISEQLSASLTITQDVTSLKRTRLRLAQAGKTRIARLKKDINTFKFTPKCANANYQHVAVIDDVITTGATAQQITRVLHQAGVKTVSIWTLAITPA
ncbi:ComF family protein [Flocculibacter collagenilyticus]|uniref:ComF family protein n=1 Tax=Flocculibacter collagenilyticus TaxID=2744479 RepID=UPI0018F63043|nr:ComF family protein [Flocculibacter collagenilyticus]